MRTDQRTSSGKWLRAALFCALVLGSLPARAGSFGIQLAGGVADHGIRKGDLGLAWNPGLSGWAIGGYHFALVGEAHVGYWDIFESGASHPNIWEFGLTPMVRFIRSSGWLRPYIEAGIGLRMLSHVRETSERTFSSSFQFADTVGVGAAFGAHQQYLAGLRFQHVSNAGLERPNPGANFSEIYLQYNF
jgi:lipid A 3-O-deacylase